MPAAERRAEPRTPRRAALRPRRLRCETCLEVLTLRHAWDVRACSCGALLLSGRPAKPTVHWLSRPGGGWTDLDAELTPDAGSTPGAGDEPEGPKEPVRVLGFSPAAR